MLTIAPHQYIGNTESMQLRIGSDAVVTPAPYVKPPTQMRLTDTGARRVSLHSVGSQVRLTDTGQTKAVLT